MLKSLHRIKKYITLAKEINKLKHKTMTNLNNISNGTKLDIKIAFDYNKNLLDKGDYIYNVDVETMQEVKEFWKSLDGSFTLLNAFELIRKSK